MIKTVAKVLKFIDTFSELSGKIFSYIILIIIALETVEVIRRHFLDIPTDWSWEASALLSGASFIIGGAWVLKERKHVRTDIIYGRLSPRARAWLDIALFSTVFSAFVGVLIWKTTQNALYSWSINERTFSMWGPPLYPLKTVVAISFILLGLQGAAKLIRDLIFVFKGEEI